MTEPGSDIAAAAEPSLLSMIAASFRDPAKVGGSVARRGMDGRALAALSLLAGILVAGTILMLPQITAMSIEQMRSNPRMPPDRVATMEVMFTKPAMKVFLVASGVFMSLLGIVVVAGFLYLGQMVMGGEATFASCLALMAFIGWIGLGLGVVVKTALVMAKGSFEVATGLGVLALDRPMNDPVRAILDGFDAFVLWGVWAAGVALAAPARLSRGTAFAVSIGVFLLVTGLQVAMRLLGSIFGG